MIAKRGWEQKAQSELKAEIGKGDATSMPRE